MVQTNKGKVMNYALLKLTPRYEGSPNGSKQIGTEPVPASLDDALKRALNLVSNLAKSANDAEAGYIDLAQAIDQ